MRKSSFALKVFHVWLTSIVNKLKVKRLLLIMRIDHYHLIRPDENLKKKPKQNKTGFPKKKGSASRLQHQTPPELLAYLACPTHFGLASLKNSVSQLFQFLKIWQNKNSLINWGSVYLSCEATWEEPSRMVIFYHLIWMVLNPSEFTLWYSAR